LADQKLNREEIQMQTLTMNEQEMVAGGESWTYEGYWAVDTEQAWGVVGTAAVGGFATGVRVGAGGGIGGAITGGIIGAGIMTGVALSNYYFTGLPTNYGRVTIEELGVGGGGGGGGGMGGGGLGGGGSSSGSSIGSGMEGSRCF
jgi:hypothetical protein